MGINMKVKIINLSDLERLENRINEFISNVEVVDIKFAKSEYHTSVLIMYNEIGDDKEPKLPMPEAPSNRKLNSL